MVRVEIDSAPWASAERLGPISFPKIIPYAATPQPAPGPTPPGLDPSASPVVRRPLRSAPRSAPPTRPVRRIRTLVAVTRRTWHPLLGPVTRMQHGHRRDGGHATENRTELFAFSSEHRCGPAVAARGRHAATVRAADDA